MYKVFLDTINAEETLTRMQIQIRDVGHEIIPQQLTAWQVEDMRRQFPNTDTPNYVSAETHIWPRSRTYEQMHKRRESRVRLFKKPLTPLPRIVGTLGKRPTTLGAHRPILRPALFQKLVDRMTEMMAVNLKWVTSQTEGSQAPTSGPDADAAKRRSKLGPSNFTP